AASGNTTDGWYRLDSIRALIFGSIRQCVFDGVDSRDRVPPDKRHECEVTCQRPRTIGRALPDGAERVARGDRGTIKRTHAPWFCVRCDERPGKTAGLAVKDGPGRAAPDAGPGPDAAPRT